MKCGPQVSSRAVAGNTGFLSGCDRNFGELPELPKGSLTSFRVARGNSRSLLNRSRGIWRHLALRGGCRGFSRVAAGRRGTSRIATRTSGEPLMLPKGSQASFRVARGNLGLISNCFRGIQTQVMWETWDSSRIVTGILGFLSSCNGDVSEPLVLPQGSQASFGVSRGTSGFLSSCCREMRPHL